ncbi:MAG TPA: hypothetical protein VGW31_11220 [Hanamia sp.]|nr:hypothetical protein [Hanamia sp.]
MRKFVVVLFVLGSLFSMQNIFAQLPEIKSSVDKNDILIGEQLHYRVETSMPDNTYRLTWFTIPDSFGKFEVITKNKIDSGMANGNLNFSQTLVLTNFDSGRRVIPSLALKLETLDGDSSFTMFTDSIAVNVLYSPLDSIQPFHDIKPIMEVKKEWAWWVWALLGLAIILLIVWIIFLVKFLRKKKGVTELFSSKLSPYEEALQSLSALEKEQLIEMHKEKKFHSRLTEIFKRYLSRKTNINKLHLTSDEILIELSDYDLPKQIVTEFANCLRMGNAVKFAQYIPPAYENEKCFSQTKEIITAINNFVNKKPESDL